MEVAAIIAGILEVDRLSDEMAQKLEGDISVVQSYGTRAQLMLRWPHNVA